MSAESVIEGLNDIVKFYDHAVRSTTANEKIELEARVGVKPNFSGTNRLYWQNAKEYCISVNPVTLISKIRDTIYGEYRSRQINDGIVVWQRKKDIKVIDVYNYWTRIALNTELILTDVPKMSGQPTHRNITRHSYDFKFARVDFSSVNIVTKDTTLSHNEMEVEFTGNIETDLRRFGALINTIVQRMFKSRYIFSYRTLTNVSNLVNTELGDYTGRPMINRSLMSEAKTLSVGMIKEGGIVGEKDSDLPKFRMSLKTDGYRRLLVISKLGTWLIHPPYDAMLISRATDIRVPITVVDCEYYIDPRTYLYNVVVIDSLIVAGEDVRQKDQNDRISMFHEYRDSEESAIDKSIIEVLTKKNLIITKDNFFEQFNSLWDDRVTAGFPVDGIIFTPVNESYDVSTKTDRTILKWKPEITIDFRINYDSNGRLDVQVENSSTRQMENFLGSDKRAFFPEMIEDNDILKQAQSGAVLEFKWIWTDNKHLNGKLLAIKDRLEKAAPNSADVALKNWEKMTIDSEILTEDDMRGKTSALMRAYHSRIKSVMFAEAAGTQQNKILLDIGSGRGADVAKWKGFRKIVCVEPLEANIMELDKRARNVKIIEKLVIVKGFGQETEKIKKQLPAEGADVISMMDSLTFFFNPANNYADLRKLATTIRSCLKPGGIFIWKALNGELIKTELMKKYSDDGIYKFGNDCYIDTRPQEKADIRVTISRFVDDQDEWLTDMMKFCQETEMGGETHRAVKSVLLSGEFKELSSYYSYGELSFNPTNKNSQTKNFKADSSILNKKFKDPLSAVLAAFPAYGNERKVRDLAIKLLGDVDSRYDDPNLPYIHYETVLQCEILLLYGESLRNGKNLFSMENIIEILKGKEPLDEIISLAVADLLGIDVFIVKIPPARTQQPIKVQTSNAIEGKYRPAIVLQKSQNDYVYYSANREIFYEPQDPLLKKLDRQKEHNIKLCYLEFAKEIVDDKNYISDTAWDIIKNDEHINKRMWLNNEALQSSIVNYPSNHYINLAAEKFASRYILSPTGDAQYDDDNIPLVDNPEQYATDIDKAAYYIVSMLYPNLEIEEEEDNLVLKYVSLIENLGIRYAKEDFIETAK